MCIVHIHKPHTECNIVHFFAIAETAFSDRIGYNKPEALYIIHSLNHQSEMSLFF